MALPALLILLGSAAFALPSRRRATRPAGILLLSAGVAAAVAGQGWGMGLTTAALLCMACTIAVALLAPLRPRLTIRSLPIAALVLALAAAGGW